MPRSSPFGLLVVICLGAALPAAAQQPSRPSLFLNANLALQDGPQKLAVSVPTPVFGVPGTIDVDDGIDGTTLVDLSGGVWTRRFLIGVGYFESSRGQSHEFTASTTPASPGSFRRTLNDITPSLQHRERLVYLSAGLVRTVTDRFDLAVSAGPAFFFVAQDVPEWIAQTDDYIGGLVSMQTRRVEESAIGFHAALDLNYMFHPRIGIGSVVRYSYASVDLPDGTDSMPLGGVQFGAGARVRF